MKHRLVFLALLAALAALFAAGCGGGGDSSGGGDPASVVPAQVPFYMDFTLRPEGDTKTNIEALAKEIAGIEDLSGLIVSELEKSASDEGESFDFEKEVEPWLGKKGGLFLPEYGEGNFEGYGAALQAEDEGEAREFVDNQVESSSEDFKDGSY
ncbi:MAG TPA: hypothetical protein VFP21_12390, partial [Solirubrobacterales bacterium]|nr:hypothetical protein [Solirubrobacterales bacterium]